MASLDWSRDKTTWPHAAHSRFVDAGGWRWHVQHFKARARGAARPRGVLLLHGTGASSHSWRALAPLLARRFDVLVPDLPGHAFTTPLGARRVTLPAVAEAVAALLRALEFDAGWIVGHSAGAAVGVQMCEAGLASPAQVVSLNGALLPLEGPVYQWFSPLAKWLVINPVVPHVFAWHASQPSVLRRLLAATGSQLDDEGVALYGRLVADARHGAGALRLMASWDLRPLAAGLPALRTPLLLVATARDRTVPPEQAERVHALVPGSRLVRLPGLGHLAHEEDPAAVLAALGALGALTPPVPPAASAG